MTAHSNIPSPSPELFEETRRFAEIETDFPILLEFLDFLCHSRPESLPLHPRERCQLVLTFLRIDAELLALEEAIQHAWIDAL